MVFGLLLEQKIPPSAPRIHSISAQPNIYNLYISNSNDFIVLASKLPIAYMIAEFVLVNSAAYHITQCTISFIQFTCLSTYVCVCIFNYLGFFGHHRGYHFEMGTTEPQIN